MNIGKKIVEYSRMRKAIRELYALDDHALADIGISRSQIRSAVRGK